MTSTKTHPSQFNRKCDVQHIADALAVVLAGYAIRVETACSDNEQSKNAKMAIAPDVRSSTNLHGAEPFADLEAASMT